MRNPSPAALESEQALRAAQDQRDIEHTRQYLRLALTRRKDHLAIAEEAIAALGEFASTCTHLPIIDKLFLGEEITDATQGIAQALRALTDAIAGLTELTGETR